MTWQRKSRPKIKVVRRKLSDGTYKDYQYERKPPTQQWSKDSVTALVETFRRSPQWAALSKNTQASYDLTFRILEKRGHIAAKNVQKRELWALHDAIAMKHPAKAASFIACTRALFNFGVKRNIVQLNPAIGIEIAPLRHWPAWTPEQAERAMIDLPEHLRRVVVLGLYTGQRRGDLITMGWTAYDGRTIRLVQQKTGRGLILPVHPALKAELDQWDRKATTILVNAWGRPWTGDVISHGMSAALDKLGFPPNLNIHGLRKLAAASLAEAGCSMHEIAAITGHTTLKMVQLYTASADQERLAEAAIIRLVQNKRVR